MRAADQVNAIWLFGTPLKDDDRIERLRNVLEYPVVKKAIVLEKLNRILERMDITPQDVAEAIKMVRELEKSSV